MITVVTGSRNFKDESTVFSTLDKLNRRYGIEILLTGKCAKGTDHFAEVWAVTNGIQLILIPANWRGPDSLNAGKVRNGLLLRNACLLAKPQIPRLLAFAAKCIKPSCPNREVHWSHGTKDCWDKAIAMGFKFKAFTDETLI